MLVAVDKVSGISSFDVIRIMKRSGLFHKKIWHSGTLDPMASGLMILATDKDTKKLTELIWLNKSYITTIDFSKMSDTWDMDYRDKYEEYQLIDNLESNQEMANSEMIDKLWWEKDIPDSDNCDSNDLEMKNQVVANNRVSNSYGIIKDGKKVFAPSIEQIEIKLKELVPSAILPLTPFSAKKVKWKKMYELAREGKAIITDKEMKISDYEILEYNFPKIKLRLDVGSWTYIRSIWYRLGKEFSLWGILTELRRTKIWDRDIENMERNKIEDHRVELKYCELGDFEE